MPVRWPKRTVVDIGKLIKVYLSWDTTCGSLPNFRGSSLWGKTQELFFRIYLVTSSLIKNPYVLGSPGGTPWPWSIEGTPKKLIQGDVIFMFHHTCHRLICFLHRFLDCHYPNLSVRISRNETSPRFLR